MRDNDFNGNYEEAHKNGDLGIDLLLVIDKSRWTNEPSDWWVPIADLIAVYKRMGLTQVTETQLRMEILPFHWLVMGKDPSLSLPIQF